MIRIHVTRPIGYVITDAQGNVLTDAQGNVLERKAGEVVQHSATPNVCPPISHTQRKRMKRTTKGVKQ